MSGVASLFLDTNVLAYARDISEPAKHAKAQALLDEIFLAGLPVLSTQVLAEYFWTVTRKIPVPLTLDEATADTNRVIALTMVVPITLELFQAALQAVAQHGLPLWDAQILAAARLSRSTTVLSEDFQNGQTIGGVTFLNPFAAEFDLGRLLQT